MHRAQWPDAIAAYHLCAGSVKVRPTDETRPDDSRSRQWAKTALKARPETKTRTNRAVEKRAAKTVEKSHRRRPLQAGESKRIVLYHNIPIKTLRLFFFVKFQIIFHL